MINQPLRCVSVDSLRACALAYGVLPESMHFRDSDYACPEPTWVTDAMGSALARYFLRIGVRPAPGKMECNHFADIAKAEVIKAWYKTPDDVTADNALAMGTITHPHQAAIGHVRLFAFHMDLTTGLWIQIYEPQPNQLGQCLTIGVMPSDWWPHSQLYL